MENRADYVAPLEIGDLMRGNGVGRVIESNHAQFPVGTLVCGGFGWQEYALSDGRSIPLRPVPEGVPLTASLSALGTTGLTAYWWSAAAFPATTIWPGTFPAPGTTST